MKNKSIFSFVNIFLNIILLKNIICTEHEGKCVYISTESGSEIINFHKFKNNKHKFHSNIISKEKEKWSINLCNDTNYVKYYNNSNNNRLAYDSQIVYTDTDNKKNYILTGGYLKIKNNKDEKFKLIKENNKYIYQAQLGNFCDENKKINYSTSIIFESGKVDNKKYAEIYEIPDIDVCSPTLKLYYDNEYSKDYLILQKVLNDGYIFIGTIFISLGIFLCIFSSQFLYLTKIIISLIFAQIIMFCFEIIVVGNSTAFKGNLYILIIIIGTILGGLLGYFCIKKDKLYLILLAFSSGFVNGIYVFDMCFIKTNCDLTIDILIDVVLIFTISFISLMYIAPKNHIYYPPIIGSYILIRGISLFMYKFNKKMGYRDLQLLLYLVKLYENDLVDSYLKNDFKFFWVYVIFISLILILSEIHNYLLNKKNIDAFIEDEDDEEENENENGTELSNEPLNINNSSRNNSIQME